MLAVHGLVHTVQAAEPAKASVYLFLRVDCPIGNRYAPELIRIAREFSKNADFFLVYPDPSTTDAQIHAHIADFGFPGKPLRDPRHELVRRAHAVTAPEAAVFDASGKLEYHGRIDDLYVDAGRARPAARTHDLEAAIAAVVAGRTVAHPETAAVGCSLADVPPANVPPANVPPANVQ
ncbi:MAG TPA: hypothetical protein VKS01_12520 [Bryobacteraceae bacterium]|nr:hypothetical protein [Bryobacteraceae bacterium]